MHDLSFVIISMKLEHETQNMKSTKIRKLSLLITRTAEWRDGLFVLVFHRKEITFQGNKNLNQKYLNQNQKYFFIS